MRVFSRGPNPATKTNLGSQIGIPVWYPKWGSLFERSGSLFEHTGSLFEHTGFLVGVFLGDLGGFGAWEKTRADHTVKTPPPELKTEPYGMSYGQKPFGGGQATSGSHFPRKRVKNRVFYTIWEPPGI